MYKSVCLCVRMRENGKKVGFNNENKMLLVSEREREKVYVLFRLVFGTHKHVYILYECADACIMSSFSYFT